MVKKSFLLAVFFVTSINSAFAETFLSDPGADGGVEVQGKETWAGAHDAITGDFIYDTITLSSIQVSPLPDYTIRRGFLSFNTSAIPDNAQIDSVQLCATVLDKKSDGGSFHVVSNTQSSNSDLFTSDYNKLGTTSFAEVLVSSLTVEQEFCINLNEDGIAEVSLNGYTKYGLREDHDFDDESPLENTHYGATVYTAEEDNKEPKLIVEYTVPSSSSASSQSSSTISSQASISPPPSCTGTGCAINSTGSLLITNTVCDSFYEVLNGSGNVIGVECIDFSTSIQIPAVKFFLDEVSAAGYSSVIVLIVLFILFKWAISFLGWAWRIVTQRS